MGLNDNFLNFKQASPLADSANTADTSDILTQIKILQSESLMARVLAKLKAPEPLIPEPGSSTAWRKLLNLPDPEPLDARNQALTYAKRNFKVRAAPQTRIIEVTVDSMNPQIAASFADTLASEFIEENLESRWKTTEHTGEWLSRQLDDMRAHLEQSEDALQAYARQAGLIFSDDKANVSEEKLARCSRLSPPRKPTASPTQPAPP